MSEKLPGLFDQIRAAPLYMKAIVVGAVLVWLIPLAVLFALDPGGDDTTAERQPDAQPDARQVVYDALLREARAQLRDADADLYCEPDYWRFVSGMATDVGGERVLIEFAMADACREEGHIEGQYSPYH